MCVGLTKDNKLWNVWSGTADSHKIPATYTEVNPIDSEFTESYINKYVIY